MTRLATDTFDRADGGLGANWTRLNPAASYAALALVSNQVRVVTLGVPGGEYYSGMAFPDNQYARVQLVTVLTDNSRFVELRLRTAASGLEYAYLVDVVGPLGASVFVELAKIVAGVFTSLGSTLVPIVSGALLRAEANGTTLRVQVNGSTVLGPLTDGALTTGSPGISLGVPGGGALTDVVIDDFEAGDFVTLDDDIPWFYQVREVR